MTGDKRIQNSPWQGRIAVLLLILTLIAVPAVALGTDLTSNTTEPTAGVLEEIPPTGTEGNTTPEQTPTEAAENDVTPTATGQPQVSAHASMMHTVETVQYAETPTGGVIPAADDVYLEVANDAGVRFDDFGNDTFRILWTTGGLNALHISNGAGTVFGEVTETTDRSGTFYVTATGGRGYFDNIFLCVAGNGTIPDDFRLHIHADGYQWAPNPTPHLAPAPENISYADATLDEWFTKDDLIYGPQTWRPANYGSQYPLFPGQDVGDESNQFGMMFIDLNAGTLDNHPLRVNYTIENLDTMVAFNVYGYCQSAESVNDYATTWTNRLTGVGEFSGWYVCGTPLPVADFTANVTSGDAPLTVAFTDASSGDPTSWAWDFENDGIVDSNERNSTHTYTAIGTYTVNLTVANDGGSDSRVKTSYITVRDGSSGGDPPIADFTANVTAGVAPLTVAFTDASTGNPTSWAWDFENDGTVDSTEQNATFTYASAGTYTVNLTVENDDGGDSEVKTDYITVTPPPAKTWTVGASGCDFVTLEDALGSSSVVEGDTVFVYNGTYAVSGVIKPVSITGEGAEIVTLDLGGSDMRVSGTGTIIENVRFTNGRLYFNSGGGVVAPPTDMIVRNCIFENMKNSVTNLGAVYLGLRNNTLIDNTFRNNDVVILIYAAAGAGGGDNRIENNTFTNTTSTLSGKGVIRLATGNGPIVCNNSFSDNDMPCIVIMMTIKPGTRIYLNDFVVPDGIAPVKWQGPAGAAFPWVTPQEIPYTYQGSSYTKVLGNYWNTYNGTDADGDGIGDTSYSLVTNQIDEAPLMSSAQTYLGQSTSPIALFTANVTSGDTPLTVAFTDASAGSPTSWAWDFENDGTVDSTGQNPTHTYTAAGNYTVNLTVANNGGSDSMIRADYIDVAEPHDPSLPAPLPAPRHIFFEVANDAGVKYNLDGAAYSGPNGTYYIKADGGGQKELHITNDAAVPAGQVTVSNDRSGVFWITNTGGRGFYDNIILLVSVNGTIPDDFALHVKSSGYTWTPSSTANELPTEYTYVEGAVDETFTKEDFIYGPQTWKPGPGDLVVPSLPLYYGQDINDVATASHLMFVDLNVGDLKPGALDATLTENGGAKVEFTFTNLTTTAAFNGYGWCLASGSGQGISWTNKVSDADSSGYSVTGLPYSPPSAPIANFTANVTSGNAPLTVQFTDASTGSPTSWAWDFENDGTIDSTEQNPVHTYTTVGTYTVNLTVANDGGSDSAVKTDYIVVTESQNPQPAGIVVTPATAELTVGATQAFAATVYDTDGGAMDDVTVTWTSSNGTVGTLNTAGLFTARAPGTTTVTAAYANVAGTAVVTVTRPQGDRTRDTPLDIPGCNVTTGNDGKPQVSINTTATNATVSGNTIRIVEGNFTLTIETEGAPTVGNGTVNGTVAGITLDTQPVVTELGSVGTVSASVSANLTGLPQGAGLTTTVSQNVSADAQSAFQLAASADGLTLGDVAYTMNIVRTNLENGQDIAGATIRMTVSPAWVAAHGGADAIRIIRSAEDGTREVLATTLVGTDTDGMMVFEAVSPNGLSVFGLAAATAASSPSSASSSSGGSSGTSTAVGAASNLKSGESVTLAMDATAISAVTLTAKTDIKDAMVTVAKGSLPQAAEPPAGTVYQYVQATLYKASEADLSAVQFRFAVPNRWLAENGCTAGEVVLLRYADGAWQAVPVEVLGEENGNAVFSADPDGFGLFAIIANEQAPGTTGEATLQPTATATPVQAEAAAQTAGSTPTPQASPLPVWAAILAFGVLFLVKRRT